MGIKGIIFDVDGTLLDTMPVWTDSGERYLASQGIAAEPGLGDKLFTMTVEMGANYLKTHYPLEGTIEEIGRGILSCIEEFYLRSADFKPGARALIERLKAAGIPMVLATSTDKYLILGAFERLGYVDAFDGILTCGEVGASKADPKIFFEAIKILGTRPEETWLFEDGLYSIKTARAAGFKTVGIYDPVSWKDQEEIRKLSDLYLTDLRDFTLIKPAVLSIAGSDSSGGAGIQADLKTMTALGTYAMSAITAVTAQNTCGVTAIAPLSPEVLAAQLDAVFTDIFPAAVKIGMISGGAQARIIGEKLAQYQAAHVVVDPVMVSTSGHRLMGGDTQPVLMETIFPLAEVITPNLPEAEVLLGAEIKNREDMAAAAETLGRRYGTSVLIKGGHLTQEAGVAADVLFDGEECRWYEEKLIPTENTHGTGCTLSSAIAAYLARGYALPVAIERAKAYLTGALSAMLDLGQGAGPVDHGFGIW